MKKWLNHIGATIIALISFLTTIINPFLTIPVSAATGTQRTATRCSYCSGGSYVKCTKATVITKATDSEYPGDNPASYYECIICGGTARYWVKKSCSSCSYFTYNTIADEFFPYNFDTICSKSSCWTTYKSEFGTEYHYKTDSDGTTYRNSCTHGYTNAHNLECTTHPTFSEKEHYYNNTYGYVGSTSSFYTNPITINCETGITTTTSIPNATVLTETATGNQVTITPTGSKESSFKVTNSVTGDITRVAKGSTYTFTMPAEPVTLTVEYGQDPQPVELELSKDVVSYLDEAPTLTVNGVQTSITSYSSSNTDVAEIDNNGIITIKNAGTTEISVVAAENDNWLETTKTITLVVNKGNISIDSTSVNVSEITYGNKLSNSTITADLPTYKGSNVEGNYTWENPNDILNAGTNSCNIVFTPNDTTNYNTVVFSKDVVVNKAPIEIVDSVKNSLSASAIEYEQTLADSIITGNTPQAGHWEWKLSSTQPTVSDSGTTEYAVVFIPDDTNYATAETTLTLIVNKKSYSFSASDIAALNIGSLTYGQMLNESAITGITPVSGSYQWVDGSIIPTVNGTNSYAAQFIPTDTNNYEIINLGNLSVAVNKADPVITAEQLANITTSAIDYGHSLSESIITADSVTPGNFTWVNGSKKPTVQEGISDTFEIIFTPDDVNNYNTKIINVKVTVNQTPIILSDDVKNSVSATEITYENTLADSIITGNNPIVNSETITGHYEWKNPTTQPAVRDSENTLYSVVFIPDNNNYANAEMTLAVKVNKKAFTFTTENVNNLTCTDLVYNQSLSESIISGDMPIVGTYRWKDSSIKPTVLGENNYIVEFVPNDTNNYEIVEVGSIHVNVVKSDPIITEEQISNIRGSEITYGQSLNDSRIYATSTTPGVFVWTDNTIKPNVSDSEFANYEITFTPTDTDNYNIKTFNIKIKVNPLVISELPIETKNSVSPAEITYGDSLEDSIISGDNPIINGVTITGHYEWKNPTTQPNVNDSGTTLYDVVFIPDSDNYAPIELQIPVVINKKVIDFNPEEIAPNLTIGNLIYGQKLSESTISGTTPVEGVYRWKNGDTITPVANDTTKYTIEFVPNDTDNYEIVDVLDIAVVVNKSSNTITEEQLNAITVTDIIYGQKLSESTINATSTIPGTFAWENEDIIPTVLEGISNTYNIVFTPDDTNNYESTIISIKVKVNKATPAVPDDINVNITASDIEVGQPLGQSQLSYIGETTLNGELSWANPDIIPTIADSDVILYDVIFTPIDNANYTTITYNTTLHVNKTDAPEKYIDYKIPTSTNSGTKNTIDFNNILSDIIDWNISSNTITFDDPDNIFKKPISIENGILSYEINSTAPINKIGKIKVIVTSRDYVDFDIIIEVTSTRKTSSSSSSRPGSSNSSNAEDNYPLIDGKAQSWTNIAKNISKLPVGTEQTIYLNGNLSIPDNVIKAISESKAKITFIKDSTFNWVIDGSKLIAPFKTLDLSIDKNNNNPTIDKASGINGTNFTTKVTQPGIKLNVSFKKDHNGKIANLYKKNEDSSYKFVNNVRITDDGVANNLDVNTAGDYTIMLSDLSDKLGDVNSDLYVNANDALSILKHSVGLNININCAVADLNNDNYINAKDSLIVLKTSLGLM